MKTMKHFVSLIVVLPVLGAIACWSSNDYEYSKGLGQNIEIVIFNKDPGTKHSGVFYLEENKMLETKKNIKENKFFLSPEERATLIESKISRANARIDSLIAQIEEAKRIKQNSK